MWIKIPSEVSLIKFALFRWMFSEMRRPLIKNGFQSAANSRVNTQRYFWDQYHSWLILLVYYCRRRIFAVFRVNEFNLGRVSHRKTSKFNLQRLWIELTMKKKMLIICYVWLWLRNLFEVCSRLLRDVFKVSCFIVLMFGFREETPTKNKCGKCWRRQQSHQREFSEMIKDKGFYRAS